MKTTVKSATKNQRIVNTKQTSKANVNKKRVIVYIPIFKSDEASVIKIKQEGSFIESPILQLEETIVIKQEDCFDQKLSSLQTISTEQDTQVDVDDTPIISDESHIKKLSVNNTSFVGTKRPEPVVVDDANNTCQSHNYQYEDTYKFHLVTAHKLKRGPIGKSLPKLKPQPNIIPVADDPNNTCRSCNHTFASKQSYRKHLMAIHKMKLEPLNGLPRLKPQPNVAPVVDDSNNYCRSCKYQFSSKRAYRWHLTKLHKMKFKPVRKGKPRPKPQADLSPVPDDPTNTCRSCKYRFVSKICYRRHLINVHKIKLEPLERSSPKLKPRPNITPAVDDPNNTCRSCQHQFYSKPGYKRHLINVHKMKLEPLKVIKWKAQSSTPPSKHNR